ncbi:MAG: hypothetical protein RXR31_03870 [Thermoproteota archaeon]|jgi:hypothetical protein
MSYAELPLENIILDILKKKQKISEKELINELKKLSQDYSIREIYRVLMVLELFEKVIVLSQKEGKIIMLRDQKHGG